MFWYGNVNSYCDIKKIIIGLRFKLQVILDFQTYIQAVLKFICIEIMNSIMVWIVMHILSELEYGYIINLFRQIDYLDVTMKYVDKFVLINMFRLLVFISLQDLQIWPQSGTFKKNKISRHFCSAFELSWNLIWKSKSRIYTIWGWS